MSLLGDSNWFFFYFLNNKQNEFDVLRNIEFFFIALYKQKTKIKVSTETWFLFYFCEINKNNSIFFGISNFFSSCKINKITLSFFLGSLDKKKADFGRKCRFFKKKLKIFCFTTITFYGDLLAPQTLLQSFFRVCFT